MHRSEPLPQLLLLLLMGCGVQLGPGYLLVTCVLDGLSQPSILSTAAGRPCSCSAGAFQQQHSLASQQRAHAATEHTVKGKHRNHST
jgi:hypothetical protein